MIMSTLENVIYSHTEGDVTGSGYHVISTPYGMVEVDSELILCDAPYGLHNHFGDDYDASWNYAKKVADSLYFSSIEYLADKKGKK